MDRWRHGIKHAQDKDHNQSDAHDDFQEMRICERTATITAIASLEGS